MRRSLLERGHLLKQVAQRATTIAHQSPICQSQISFQKHINEPRKPEACNRTRPSFYACLVTSNLADDLTKNNELAWRHHFSFVSLREMFSVVRSCRNSNSSEILCMSSLPLLTCKYKKDRIKNNRENVETSFSPL